MPDGNGIVPLERINKRIVNQIPMSRLTIEYRWACSSPVVSCSPLLK